jgi:hypothetical protein
MVKQIEMRRAEDTRKMTGKTRTVVPGAHPIPVPEKMSTNIASPDQSAVQRGRTITALVPVKTIVYSTRELHRAVNMEGPEDIAVQAKVMRKLDLKRTAKRRELGGCRLMMTVQKFVLRSE